MTTTRFSVTRQSAVSQTAMDLIQRRELNPTDVWGIPYGFDLLDRATGGIHTKEDSGTNELTVLGARSNVGKSSFGVSVAINVAMEFKRSYPGLQVRIITLEMSPAAMYRRTIGQLADVPFHKINTGRTSPEERKRLRKADAKLKTLPITYIEGSYDMGAITEFISRHDTQTDQDCGYFVLDHIQIVPSDVANRSGNHTFALGQISRQLHHLARQYCPGMVLAQLNREMLRRKDATPNAGDLAQSDKILQDADVVLLLHRPEMATETTDGSDEIGYCIIEKNREGAAGRRLPMSFTPRTALWGDIDA